MSKETLPPWHATLATAPHEWLRRPYGDILEPREEIGFPNLPLLGVTSDRGVISRDKIERRDTSSKDKSKYKRVLPGDLVYNTMRMWQGVSGQSELEGIVSPAYTVMTPAATADGRFLAYQLKYPPLVGLFRAFSQGLVDDTLSLRFDTFARIQTLLPPLLEQRRIAAILSSVDYTIARTQAVIEQVEVVKKGLIQELLARGLPGRHKKFKKTEVGEIPEKWEVKTLGDITIDSAFGPRFPADNYATGGNYATLRTTDVTDDWEINYDTMPRASLPKQQFDKHRLHRGDLLVTRSGTCGVVCVFEQYQIPVLPGAFLIRFRLSAQANPQYVRLMMMMGQIQRQIQKMASGGVQSNLSGSNLKTLPVIVPSLVEQGEIVQVASALDDHRRASRRVHGQLLDLKQTLLSVLLTGEARVKPDPKAA